MATELYVAERPARPRAAAVPVVRLEGLTKRFAVRRSWAEMLRRPGRREWRTVVRDVRCEVGEGEFFGLLGPNGAGKTTLFKMLATLVSPDAGTAVVDGHDLVREPAAVRRTLTPVVADERSLAWRLSATENLRLYATLHGLPGAEGRRRASELLELVGLSDRADSLVGTFSSGMKQRLLVARALLARPRVLLLDEPTRSLDPLSARALRRFLREEVAGRARCTVLLATHNTEEALELCDRVAVLDQGRLLAVGAPTALAHEHGGDRYLLATNAPRHPALYALEARGVARVVATHPAESEGWSDVELELPGGLARAAEALASLTLAGMTVGRLERVPLSLATLIERIIDRRREP
ncbi:MAG TPA: ABC transporter ATP-binding protein [Gemmatimonadaceae bacterium]|nr:ABC transporter ATP-binding protein [Gemmatimonadaceae bacterium]